MNIYQYVIYVSDRTVLRMQGKQPNFILNQCNQHAFASEADVKLRHLPALNNVTLSIYVSDLIAFRGSHIGLC